MTCKICGNSSHNTVLSAREMMFGIRDTFDYLECSQCGCVQIIKIPSDMGKYYPAEYYSFHLKTKRSWAFKKIVKTLMKPFRDHYLTSYALHNRGLIGKLVYSLTPYERSEAMRGLYHVGFNNKQARILDVGCGNGELLLNLRHLGFTHLTGVDPFLSEDIHYDHGITIHKKYVTEVEGEYDLIMFHHSFEHISNPEETLAAVQKLLAKDGICVIRIPVADSEVFSTYKTNDVELDAPRHFFLHTTKSMEVLAQKTSLKITKEIHDATAFQFLGSEQYLKDIPLMSEKSYLKGNKSLFSEEKIKFFQKRTEELNKAKKGARAIYVLTQK